ncbi:MAG: hypothetical protein V4670_09675 [Bacteroidota bacterium]
MCFLIPALVGLICALLGYLLGKMLSGGNDLNLQSKLDASLSENEKLNNKVYLLEKELAAAKNNTSSSSSKTAQGFAAVQEAVIPFDGAALFAVFGKKFKQDDLKIVEGIGPKIEELYKAAGIKTWKALSETPVEKSQAILDTAGSRYAVHNPKTWAKQSLLAYQGKWKELKKYQDSLNGGKK